MSKISFAPFDRECVEALQTTLAIDYFGTDFSADHWLCASARDNKGALLGLACFELKTHFDAYFTAAIFSPRFMSRRLLRAMFTAVFSRAVRVTAEIEPHNTRALLQAKRMGFSVEGYKVLGIEGRRDAVQLGMTRETCKYLCGTATRFDPITQPNIKHSLPLASG
jgi:hypothetical protein